MPVPCTTIIDNRKEDENISVTKFTTNHASTFYDDIRHQKT